MLPSRRHILLGMASLAAPSLSRSLPVRAAELGTNRLVLLGNKGGPAIRAYAPSPSANLIVYEGASYVVDAGYGVTFKLVEAGFPLAELETIFITHHHSDHNLELGALIYNAWAIGLKTPVHAFGPSGVDALLKGFLEANRFDIETRMADEGRPDLRELAVAHTYADGEIMKSERVAVTALRNRHPPIVDSFALKFAFPGKTIVFSGDTTFFPPLANFAKGADILVHEVMYGPAIEALAQRNPNAATLAKHLRASHTLAEDVGRIAMAAEVKLLVVNHFVPADDRALTEAVWTAAIRQTYDGPLLIGRDLLTVPLDRS